MAKLLGAGGGKKLVKPAKKKIVTPSEAVRETAEDLDRKLRERYRRAQQADSGGYIRAQPGVNLYRLGPRRKDEKGKMQEFYREYVFFWNMGPEGTKKMVSRFSWGQTSPMMEQYKRWKKAGEKALCAKYRPKTEVYFNAMTCDKETKKLISPGEWEILSTGSTVLGDMLALYYDEDKGNFTDPVTGYLIKITRKGKGKFGTKYRVDDSSPMKIKKEWLEKMNDLTILEAMPSLEEEKAIVEETDFDASDVEMEEDEE